MTEADLLECTMHESAHLNGGKEWFGYIHRCNQHPRLTRMDKYYRATRGVESVWRVDGMAVTSLAEAAEKLATPYQATADELTLLATVPDEFTSFEQRVRFLPLREGGLIEAKDGKFRRTDAGRAALIATEEETNG